MSTRSIKLLAAALALCAAASALTGTAQARLSCSVSEAQGKPEPARRAIAETGAFRVFWQISTQIEDLADAEGNPQAIRDIGEAGRIVDGYFINVLLGGPLIYWPGRPEQCRLNFKRLSEGDQIELDGQTYEFEEGGAAGRDRCLAQQKEFLMEASREKNAAADVQVAALGRVFENLRLAEEQRAGKSIWGVSIIRATDFSYDKNADKVTMKELPETYCVMNSDGIAVDELMIYQEPYVQTKKKNVYLWIPQKNRRGKLIYSKSPRVDAIPENTHAFNRVTEAFDAADVPVGGFRANIRRWNPKRSPEHVRELMANPAFTGFNFEGGTRIITDEKRWIDNYVQGIAWILQNTDRDVSLLMPGFWTRDMVGNEEEVDSLLPRVRETLTKLNGKLRAAMKLAEGQNAICTSRLTFIVGSYGQPVHVKPLPMRRADGELAGTVTGQIKLLSDIRSEICGR